MTRYAFVFFIQDSTQHNIPFLSSYHIVRPMLTSKYSVRNHKREKTVASRRQNNRTRSHQSAEQSTNSIGNLLQQPAVQGSCGAI